MWWCDNKDASATSRRNRETGGRNTHLLESEKTILEKGKFRQFWDARFLKKGEMEDSVESLDPAVIRSTLETYMKLAEDVANHETILKVRLVLSENAAFDEK